MIRKIDMKIEKIAILDIEDLSLVKPKHIEEIAAALPGPEIYLAHSSEELAAKTDDANVLITWPFVDRKLVEFCKTAPSLKWVHAFTTGIDGIVQSELGNLDIRITSTKGIHGDPLSDHVLAFIFSFLRTLPFLRNCQAQREWVHDRKRITADESFDKTVGIVGLGSIGTQIARKCKLLGMRVIATKRSPADSEWVDECWGSDGLDRLLEESDFVVLIVPLTPDTTGLIGEKQLRTMKKSAYLINVARGGVVDEAALIRALNENVIAGAGLDVFTVTPLPADNPLWDLPNVIITPHMAAQSPYYLDRAIKVIIANLLRFSSGENLLYEADKHRGY